MFLLLNAKKALELNMIHPGEEIFVPMGIWPNTPVKLNFRRDRNFARFRMEKGLYKSKDKCHESKEYIYGGIQIMSIHFTFVNF